jgi:hypothetical protein
MELGVYLDYHSADVGTFDPGKVILRVQEAFPDAILDPLDYSDQEVRRIVKKYGDLPQGSVMVRQIKDKQQRNGPSFRFEIPAAAGPMVGFARRYEVRVTVPDATDDATVAKLREFLKGLTLGEPEFRCERSRLADECAKLNPEEERALAEEGLGSDEVDLPEY